jgi:RNA polymerase sigma factor (sigma-70 family)
LPLAPGRRTPRHAHPTTVQTGLVRQREASDEELVQSCLREDREAWEALVRRYGRLVYGLAMRAGLSADDAADVFQTVFVTAYRNLHLLDRPESLSFWLSTITKREAWQVRRKLARRPVESPTQGDDPLETAASPVPLADEVLERAERTALVHRGLEAVDERCRMLLETLFFREPAISYEEAARALGVPLGSIGPTRARCLEKLRKALQTLGF